MATEKPAKNCDNCIYSGRPSYDYPCTECTSAYGSAPSKWEGLVPANADMVEVVRCKDCKYWTEGRHHTGKCNALIQFHDAERYLTDNGHFCAYGERKVAAEV